MSQKTEWNPPPPPLSGPVLEVAEAIGREFHPRAIYLYNQKFGANGGSLSFKLCVVGDFEDKERVEREIYRSIDSETPFHLLLYTWEEWCGLQEKPGSFAEKICRTGTLVYG